MVIVPRPSAKMDMIDETAALDVPASITGDCVAAAIDLPSDQGVGVSSNRKIRVLLFNTGDGRAR